MKRLVVSVLLVSCGGDDNGGGSVDVDSLGMELAIASCSRQFDCCTDAEIMQRYMGITYNDEPITTEEQCVTFSNAVFTGLAVVRYKESIAAGRIEYDAEAAADCVAAIQSVTCAQYSTGSIGTSDCRPFLIPKVADGAGCTQDYECTSNNCEGETVPLEGPATDGMCGPMPVAGQPCDDNCASGLYCGSDPSSSMDTCRALKTAGTQCSFDRECTSDYCDDAMRVCATEPPTCDGR